LRDGVIERWSKKVAVCSSSWQFFLGDGVRERLGDLEIER